MIKVEKKPIMAIPDKLIFKVYFFVFVFISFDLSFCSVNRDGISKIGRIIMSKKGILNTKIGVVNSNKRTTKNKKPESGPTSFSMYAVRISK